MKRLLFIAFCLTTALHAQQPAAAPHIFTSTDGRKLLGTIIGKTAATVTIRRSDDGQDFILHLARLSPADQAFVKAWGMKPAPLITANPELPESWVVPPKYRFALEFARLPGTSGPMYTIFEPSSSGGYENRRAGLIRSDGVVLCDPDKDESVPPFFFVSDNVAAGQVIASYFRDHHVFPKLSGGKWGLVDLDGNQVVPPQWDWVGSFSEGLFDFTVEGKRGYANLKGEVVIQPQWFSVRPFSGGYAIVRANKDGKKSVIDKTGNIISDAVWDDVKELRVWRGAPIPSHRSVSDFRPAELPPGVFWVAQNKKWGLYDLVNNVPLGELQWAPSAGNAHDFEYGRAWVQRDGKYGMIDLTGKVVMEPTWEGEWRGEGRYKYHSPPTRVGNCIKAAKDGKTAWWRLDGTPALPEGDDVEWVKHYRNYFPLQLKIESGKVIRLEKNLPAQEPIRTVLRRGGSNSRVGQMVGIADLDGKLLGEVSGSWINATPSPDYFMVTFYDPRCGLIDATGKEVEPVAEVENLPLDTLQISHPESLPDGEIVAAFRGASDTATPDALFIKTSGGLVKLPWKAPAPTIQEAPATVKPHQKDGKWGYIRLIEAKP